MAESSDELAARRARWRNYFEQTLLGGNREVEAATHAAMAAVARGEGQQAIIQAGRAAAKRIRTGGSATPPNQTQGAHAEPGRQSGPPPRRMAAGQESRAAASSSSARSVPANSGVVSLIEKRTESLDGQFFQVWSFRVMRLENGNPVAPAIPMEIRGRSIIGQLTQGDLVEVPPGRGGQTHLIKGIRNLTTGSTIEAKGRPFRRSRTFRRTWKLFTTTIRTILGLLAVAALLVIAVFVLREMDVISWPRQ